MNLFASFIPIVLLAVWIPFCVSRAGSASTKNSNLDDLANKIDQDVSYFFDCQPPPAMTLAVVKDGQVVLTKGYGHTSVDKTKKTTSKTKFAIGSLTKAFTSLLLVKAVKASKANITLDTPISKILPGFRLVDDYRSKYATLRDLLGHRVAIPGYRLPIAFGIGPHTTRQEFASKLQFLSTPYSHREKFIYNNYMYVLAGDILEQLEGRSWEDLVRDTIFKPLGMADSGFVDQLQDFSDFALANYMNNGTLIDLDSRLFKYQIHFGGPAGAIYSTAEDMVKWVKFLLSGDESAAYVNIDPSWVHEAFKPSMVVPSGVFVTERTKPTDRISHSVPDYCTGWARGFYREYKQILHDGSIVTHNSRLWLYPDVNAGLFMSLNGPATAYTQLLFAVSNRVSDLLLGLEPWFNRSEICPPKDTSSPDSDGDGDQPDIQCDDCKNLDLSQYTGTYSHVVFGDATIRLNTSSNQLIFDYGFAGTMYLTPISKDAFKGTLFGLLGPFTSYLDLGMKFGFDSNDKVFSFWFNAEPMNVYYKIANLSGGAGINCI